MWVAEYRQVLKGWALVEGTLADKYGFSLRDIVEMSWRRFVILYQYLFTSGALTRVSSDDAAASTPTTAQPQLTSGQAYDDINWDKLTGADPADRQRKVSFSEFMGGSGLTRKVVD